MNQSKFTKYLKRIVVGCGLFLAGLFLLIIVNGSTVRESALFVVRCMQNPMAVGSILPSSPHVARALCNRIPAKTGPRNILEVGAGTGPITPYIIEKLQPGDHLDLIELDEEMGALLQEKFGNHTQVSIHIGAVQSWNPGYRYDAIISTIPFNSLPARVVAQILAHYKARLLAPEGVLSCIEYALFPDLRLAFLWGEAYKKYAKLRSVIHAVLKRYGIGRKLVYANVPPAWVYYMQFGLPGDAREG